MAQVEIEQVVQTSGAGARRLLSLTALAAILALGLWLRWQRLDFAELNYDQGWSLNRAYDFVRLGDFPLHGAISSVGVSQGPIEIYLLALPLAFSLDPRVAVGFVGGLQLLAVLGTYFFARRYFGELTGLAAAALYAVNPWAVLAGRKIWPDDTVFFPALLYFAALFGAATRGSRWLFASACALWTVLFLTNPSAVLQGPLLAVALVLGWRRLGWQAPVWGALLSLVVASPYLYYDSQQGFADLQAMTGTYASSEALLDLASLNLITAIGSGRFLGEQASEVSAAFPWYVGADILATGLLVAGLAACLYRLGMEWRRGRTAAESGWLPYLLLALWFTIPVLLTARHTINLIPSYFNSAWPVQFVLIGLGLTSLGQLLRRRWPGRANARWAAGASAGALVLLLCLAQGGVALAQIDRAAQPSAGRPFGIPLVYNEQAAAPCAPCAPSSAMRRSTPTAPSISGPGCAFSRGRTCRWRQ